MRDAAPGCVHLSFWKPLTGLRQSWQGIRRFLLVPERGYGVHDGGAVGGVYAEDDADEDGDSECAYQRPKPDDRLHPCKTRDDKREQYPEDLAGTALYLATEDSDMLSGQTIVVDGGDFML